MYILNDVILITIISLGVVLLSFFIVSIAVLCPNYRACKKVYKTLKNKTFYKYGNHVLSKNDGFIWFVKTNDFKLDKFNDLYNSPIIYFDPYSLYWLMKYRYWFSKNVNINTLEDY